MTSCCCCWYRARCRPCSIREALRLRFISLLSSRFRFHSAPLLMAQQSEAKTNIMTTITIDTTSFSSVDVTFSEIWSNCDIMSLVVFPNRWRFLRDDKPSVVKNSESFTERDWRKDFRLSRPVLPSRIFANRGKSLEVIPNNFIHFSPPVREPNHALVILTPLDWIPNLGVAAGEPWVVETGSSWLELSFLIHPSNRSLFIWHAGERTGSCWQRESTSTRFARNFLSLGENPLFAALGWLVWLSEFPDSGSPTSGFPESESPDPSISRFSWQANWLT